ncbi:MAG: sigma-70 family RNA polymerase sigma factor [Kiritimatiellae bacterium]|nr:sigma-70 family RNA polymerase sigma factor [Kiritimatiellia bacterium]
MSTPLDKAFEIVARQHHRRVLAYALSLVDTPHTAEDLVQEAFLVAYRKFEQFDPSRDFGNWMRGIVRRKYLEWVKSRREQPLDEATLTAIEARHRQWDNAWDEDRGDALAALQKCLAALEGGGRRLVEWFYFRRLSGRAIAARLSVSEAAVRKRLERVRAALLACVERKLGGAAETAGADG